MKRYVSIAVIAVVFLSLLTETAAAHGTPELSGNVWRTGSFGQNVAGSASVTYGHAHDKMFIEVKLQWRRYPPEENVFVLVDPSTIRTKTLYNTNTIYRQTSYSCDSLAYGYDFRIHAQYKIWRWDVVQGYVLLQSNSFNWGNLFNQCG
jgi:hypothetical protein